MSKIINKLIQCEKCQKWTNDTKYLKILYGDHCNSCGDKLKICHTCQEPQQDDAIAQCILCNKWYCAFMKQEYDCINIVQDPNNNNIYCHQCLLKSMNFWKKYQ
jgi:hypothetical protein